MGSIRLPGLGVSDEIRALTELADQLDCEQNNSTHWQFQSGAGLPGHACGLPQPGNAPSVRKTLQIFNFTLTLAFNTVWQVKFLTHVSQRLAKIQCSDHEDCSSPGCDPFLSVYQTSVLCFIGSLFRELRRVTYYFKNYKSLACFG